MKIPAPREGLVGNSHRLKLFLFDCGQDQFSPPECEPDDLPGIVARNHDQVMQKLRYSAEFGDVQGTRSDCLYALRRSARIALERALGQASGEPEYEHAAHAKAHRCWRVSCEARSKGGFCNSLDRLSCTASQALLVMGFGACLCFGGPQDEFPKLSVSAPQAK